MRPPLRRRARGAARGYLILELALAVALACLAAVWGADAWRRDIEAAAGRATGAWLLEIRGALARMMARHQDDLVQGLPPRDARGLPAYADAHAPRLDELIRQGHLPAGFPRQSVGGMRVALRILRDPACPAPGCRLDALAYSVAPVAPPGAGGGPDPAAVAAILAAAGGHGGHVDGQAPDLIRGADFRFPNPPAPGMARLAAGTVAVWAGLDPAANWPYLRLGDRRNPDFQGDVAAAGAMHAAGALSTGGHLFIGARAQEAEPCAPDGLMARAADGAALSCIGGRWAAPGGFGGAFAVHSLFGCKTPGLVPTANRRTGECRCPAGYDAIRVSMTGDWNGPAGGMATFLCLR